MLSGRPGHDADLDLPADVGDHNPFAVYPGLADSLPGLELQVTQHFRIFDRKAGAGEAVVNLLSETHKIEGQSWYALHLELDGRSQEILGPVHRLEGNAGKRSNLVDFNGKTLQPEFPWVELEQALATPSQQV